MTFGNPRTNKADRSKPVIEAKWGGKCGACGEGYDKGDNITIVGNKDGKALWGHLRCPSKLNNFENAIKNSGVASGVKMEDEFPEIVEKVFIPSAYQQAAFTWAIDGTGHAVLKAVAGSGKTTTIVKLLDLLPHHLRILFIAYNRSIVRALDEKIRAKGLTNITIKTLNACGFTVIRKYEGFRDLNDNKVLDILTDMGYRIDKKSVPDAQERAQNRVFRSAMNKVVSMVKCTLTDYNDQDAVLEIINRYHIEIDEQMEQKLLDTLPEVMAHNNENLEYVDFDDQCYLPVIHPTLQNKFDQYDFILCDEFQDFNKCNVEFVLKCLAPDGRIIAVGDHRQSIGGYRGADTQAIPSAIARLQATVLPLSVCYRCPTSHIENVRKMFPEYEIEPAPNAKEGTLGELSYKEMMETVKEGDMVLCRTNAPLIKPAFAVIKSGRKAIIRGKEIGKELVNYIERFQTDDIGHLDILMQEHTAMEIERYTNKNKEMMAEQVKERYETIVEVMRECVTVEQLITRLRTLFSDDNIGVVFSSVHRAKGLEAERVFVYRPELMPHPRAKTTDEKEQESNCMIVAYTRSLDTLYVVYGDEQ